MVVFTNARRVFVPTMCAALAIWSASAVADRPEASVVPTFGDAAKCVDPARPPDRSASPPHVSSTFPAEGAIVRPGLVVIRINFDQPMSCYGIFQSSPHRKRPCHVTTAQPDIQRNGGQSFDVEEIWYSYDLHSIEMTCSLAANTQYGLRLNTDSSYDFIAPKLRYRKLFKSVAGLPLLPFELNFSTSSGPEIKSLKEAQAQEAAGGQKPIPRESR